jgi:CRP/FNR family transcriptional regulator
LIFKLAEPGDILGLSATVLDRPYPMTAETTEPAQLNFIKRSDFVRLLRRDAQAAFDVATQLGIEHQLACREVAALGTSVSATEKLAALFLEWGESSGLRRGKQTHVRITLTHEEIAQMIGTIRETVTRLLSKFRSRHGLD